jgi:hypothetical protein
MHLLIEWPPLCVHKIGLGHCLPVQIPALCWRWAGAQAGGRNVPYSVLSPLSVPLGSTLYPAGPLNIMVPTPPSTLTIISTIHLGCGRTASAPCQPTIGSAPPGPWRTSATPSAMGAALPTSCVSGRSLLATGGRMAPSGSPAPPGSQSIMTSWMLPPVPCAVCPCSPDLTLCPARPARAPIAVPGFTPPSAHPVPVLSGCHLAMRTSMPTLLPM